jgi:site-specific recombinase XerD
MSEQLATALLEHQYECLETLLFRDYSQHTLRTYSSHLKRFRAWVSQRSDLEQISDLTTGVITEYLVALSLTVSRTPKRGEKEPTYLSASHKSGHISALRHLFTHLHKQGMILSNPMHDVERPRERKGIPRTILTVGEILKLLASIDTTDAVGLRNRAAFELLYTAGLRSGELGRLDVSSIDLKERLVRVDGKGRKKRQVPIGKEAQRCLQDYLERGRPRLRSAGSPALFLSLGRGRMDVQSLRRFLRKYAKKAGITKHVDLHCIRHTCATHMLANGADIRYLQVLLGHSSLKSTQVYTRVELSDLRRIVDACHPRDQF